MDWRNLFERKAPVEKFQQPPVETVGIVFPRETPPSKEAVQEFARTMSWIFPPEQRVVIEKIFEL
jgi:hypothetical protein